MDTREEPQLSDESIAEESLKTPNAYGQLVNRYSDRLMRYIRRITLATEDDAEDILQDVFIKAYKNLAEFDTRLKFSSWIYRIAHNEAVNHVRKRSRIKKNEISADSSLDKDDDLSLFDRLSVEPEQEDNFDKHVTIKNVNEILKTLKPKYRDVLVLRYVEGKDYKEISDILRKPQGTVATLLNRAKKEFIKKADHNLSQIQT